MTDPITLVTGKTDKEMADQIRSDLIETSKPFLKAMSQALADGFHCNISFAPNAFDEIVIIQLIIAKHF